MERFRAALRTIFGELNWQPPGWFSASTGAVQRSASGLNASMRANPRGAALAIAGIVVLVAAGVFGWRWYVNRPQPVLTEFTVNAPGPTCYACEPPGSPNPLVVTFSASTATLERAGHPIESTKAGIDISPAVAGQWFWDDDKTLRFQPAADWPIGQQYKVELSRKNFAADARHAQGLPVRVSDGAVHRQAGQHRVPPGPGGRGQQEGGRQHQLLASGRAGELREAHQARRCSTR